MIWKKTQQILLSSCQLHLQKVNSSTCTPTPCEKEITFEFLILLYRHELHQEIAHLVNCLKHQKQHNQTCGAWTRNYNHTVAQNIALVKGTGQGPGAKEREILLEGNQKYVRDLEKQVRLR